VHLVAGLGNHNHKNHLMSCVRLAIANWGLGSEADARMNSLALVDSRLLLKNLYKYCERYPDDQQTYLWYHLTSFGVKEVLTMVNDSDVRGTKVISMRRVAKGIRMSGHSSLLLERSLVLSCAEHGWAQANTPELSSPAHPEIISPKYHEWPYGLPWLW
jgi:hypothetical protein